jgi:ATP-binding cassette subfamily B protein
MKLIFTYLKQHRKLLAAALVLAAINQIFSLLDPQIFRMIIDGYASKANTLTRNEFISGIGLLLLASVGVALVSRIAKNFQDYYVNVIVQRIGTAMYARGVGHSFSLPYQVFEDRRSGEILLKLQKVRADNQTLITSMINIGFFSLVGILFVLSYAFVVHWAVGIVYFMLIPIVGFTAFIITRKIKGIQRTIVAQTAELAGSTTETIRNVELVKSLGLEQQEIDRLNMVNERILQLELKKVRMVRMYSFVQGTTINALRSGLLLLMMWLIFNGDITLGQFFSLYIYSFFIFNPLSELGTVAQQYQETRASNEQLTELLATPSAPKPKNPITVGAIESVDFHQVEFSYNTAEQATIKGVDIKVTAGETVALVGPSGSGKSTLIKLLVGLYQPNNGEVLFNGQDSRNIDFDQLRQRIGLVSQDTQLFAGTFRENLLFVRPEATDEECLEAMKLAAADSLLERGGQGLDTKIGENGIKLSGGEKQRLAIARALLRRPEIIIFDEATSSLDSITEQAITETIRNIEKARPNVITIMVAHRLSTIAHAQKIFVLEKGAVVETGTHESLIKDGGLYAALWRQQIAVA